MMTLRFGVVALLVIAVAGCSSEVSRNKPVSGAIAVEHQAVSATPTLTTIAVDGTYADWQQVLLNPLQVSVDGNGIAGAGCYPSNPDRDCEGFTPQRDITRFAWTYDNTNVYTYLERPNSNATLTYSFIMDVNADGVAQATDRVLQVTWKTGNQPVAVNLFAYVPAVAAGDSLACPSAALCPSLVNPHAQIGFVDGYTMTGSTGALLWSPTTVPACAGAVLGDECGGDGIGTRFEVSVPWAQLGVPARSPIYWHVAASTNTQFSQAKDNLGGPDGRLGAFGVFAVDFTADLTGSMPSPGLKDYCHQVINAGQFTDLYNLTGVSSTGSKITLFTDVGGCIAGTQMAVDANGDGDFLDVGDSVTAGFDTNSDGLPDTGTLAGGATRSIIIRLTAAAGLNGATDQLVATATSTARPTLVSDTVTDRTRIGLVTVSPDLARSGTPGLVVNFGPYTIQNNEVAGDTFNLFVRSSHGYAISLYTNVANAPGALIATDSNGDGVWDAATPSSGALAAAGTVSYWLRVTIAAGAAIGTVDSVTFTATSSTTATITGAASSTLSVLSGLTLGPSYTSPSSQLVGPAGTSIYLSHFAINSLGVANTVTLAQSGVAAGYTMSWWSDPNGDGNVSDGAPITTLNLVAFGGTQYFVTQITMPATGTPISSAARTTGNGVSGSTGFADDNVSVGSLQTYSDSLFAQPTRHFPACSTIYVKGVGLTPLQTTNYQLRISNPAPAIVQNANLPTDTLGAGTGSYSLVAADAPGNWRVQIYSGVTQISELTPVIVERSGTANASGPAVAVSGQSLSVSALITNTAVASRYSNSSVTFVVTDPASAVLKTATVSVADLTARATTTVFAAWPSVAYGSYGNYTVTATWKTSCGSTIATGTTVVPYPPPAPALSTPADGAIVNSTTPSLTGTGVSGGTVNIFIDGVLAGTATGTSTFSYTTGALGQGAHTWYATQTINGVTGPASATRSFTVDSLVPAAPVVTAPASGSLVNTTTPTYTGTAEASSTVIVRVDSVVACSTTATAGGTFSCVQGTALAQGSHTVNATATDAANNVSAASTTNTFSIDSLAPNAPVVTGPANGGFVNTTTPTYTGTAEAAATVTVRVDGVVVCSAVAGAAGAFSCVQATALTQSAHSVNATATDATGNTSAVSNTNAFTVDSVTPFAPVFVAPANGSVSGTRTPTYSGTAEAGTTVAVRVDGALVCSTVAAGLGGWSCAQPTSLSNGAHSVNATATDAANNTSVASNTNTFTVVIVGPNAPIVLTPANNSFTNAVRPTYSGTSDPNNTITVSVDAVLACTATATAGGTWSCIQGMALAPGVHGVNAIATDSSSLVSAPSATNSFTVDVVAPVAPALTAPANGSSVNTSTPAYAGTAEAGSVVTVRVGAAVACVTTATGAGTFSCVQSPALTDGVYAASATATDAANNTSPVSNTNSFTVDTATPAAPVLSAPANASNLNTATPTYSGTAEAGSTIVVRADGVIACSTTATAGGTFSCVQASALGQGPHSARAVATDAANNASVPSNTNSFTIDTVTPVAPVLTAPAAGATLSTTTPTYTGTAEAGSTVKVSVDGAIACTTTATAGGAFTCLQTPALSQGAHSVNATATDSANNVSPVSNTNSFTVDTVSPLAPVVSAPAAGSTLGTTTITYSGTAEAGSTVTISVDGATVCSTTALAAGTFSCTPATALSQGAHSVNAVATDAANNASLVSNTNPFTIDTVSPAAPVVSAPANGAMLSTATPTYSGTAEASSTVAVRVDGAAVCSTTATAAGVFTCTPVTALGEGTHAVQATATDAANNVSPASNTNTFSVDTLAPSAPAVSAPAAGAALATTTPTYTGTAEAGSTVKVSVDGAIACTATATAGGTFSCLQSPALSQGAHSVNATATDSASNVSPVSNTNSFTVDTVSPAAPVVSAPANGAALLTATPTYSGTAEASSTVVVRVDGAVVCSVTATAAGVFTCTPITALAEGAHSVQATATDAANNASPGSNTNTFTVDTIVPLAPAVTAPSAGSTLSTATPAYSGTAEAGSTVTVSVDGATVCSTTAVAAGTFSCTPATALSQGAHSVNAIATDAAGNVSPVSNANSFTVDTVIPVAPVVATPASGATLSTATPTYSGTAEAGSTVTISVDGATVCSTTALAAGTFSCTPVTALSQGAHSVNAIAADAAGNISPASNTISFIVDTVSPAAPVVSAPANGAALSTATPTYSGTAEAGSTVVVQVDGAVVCSVTATSAGVFTCTPVTALSEGTHAVQATATDAANNASPASIANTFTVDTVNPETVIASGPPAATPSTSATFTFTSPESPLTFECSLDGAAFAACTSPATFSTLSEGTHVFDVRARDAAGNLDPTPARQTWVVDHTAPETSLVSGPASSTTSTSATFDFSSNEPTVSYECALDTAVYTACTDPVTFSGLSEGSHALLVRAADPAGNVDATPLSVTWSVDTTAPDTTIDSGPAAQSTSASAVFAFSSPDLTASFECSVDGASFTACSSTLTVTGLSSGSHTFAVRAKDAAGNVDATPATLSWTVVLPLDTTIVSGPPALSNNSNATFTLSSNTANVTFECSLDGAAFTACTTPVTVTGLADGLHTLRARAKDAAGGVDSSPALHQWRVDTVAPGAPVIASPTEGDKVGFSPPTVIGTAEPGSTVTVIIDGTPAGSVLVDASGHWVFTPGTPLASGSHTISATAKDAAGNAGSPSTPATFVIDTAALDTRIVSGPQGTSASASATFDFESNRPAATFECKLDGAAFTACSDPSTFTGLADGPHSLSVRAKDGAEVDATPSTRTWSVNTSGIPAPVVTAPANSSTVGSDTPEVQGTSPTGTVVTVVIDGVVAGTALADASGYWRFTPSAALSAGSHTVAARILDSAGATLATSATNTFTVDLSALDTFIVSGPNAISRLTSAAFDLASNADPVTYECSLDGAGFTACTDPVTYSSLAEGRHTLLVRAKNAAGTLDPTPASFTWVIDTMGPSTTTVLTPANGSTVLTALPTASGTAEPGAAIEVTIDGQRAGVTTADSSGAWSLPLTVALGEGTHTITATATDQAGNQGAPSGTNTFTVITSKLSPPSITGPATGQSINTATPKITGKAAPNSTVTVFVDGVAVGTAVANAAGDWSLVLTTPLTDAMHAITASARLDPRQSDVSAATLITVDTVAPETVIKSGPAATTTSSTANFELSSNETGGHFECSLDGGPFTACGAKPAYSDLAEGAHTLAVRAVDEAGNRDPSPAIYQWSRTSDVIKHKQSLAGGGCGCNTVEPGTVLALLGLWVARRRRRHA